jgi:hypothetical protein
MLKRLFSSKIVLPVGLDHVKLKHEPTFDRTESHWICELPEYVIEWLTTNNIKYKFKSTKYKTDYHYWVWAFDIIKSKDPKCHHYIKPCNPRIIFNNKNDAVLFKLTWG